MSLFGDYPSNGPTPIGEAYFQTYVNATLAAGENLYSFGTFTMPFGGKLTCEIYAELTWPGTAGVATWLSVVSSPATNSTADLSVNQCGVDSFNCNAELRSHAYWTNQGPGAVITASARLYCTAGGVVYCRYVGGFWRPSPTLIST